MGLIIGCCCSRVAESQETCLRYLVESGRLLARRFLSTDTGSAFGEVASLRFAHLRIGCQPHRGLPLSIRVKLVRMPFCASANWLPTARGASVFNTSQLCLQIV